jgi:monovalent cation/hydrogen antiporter
MQIFEVLLGLLAACVALALIARRLHTPVAVVLMVGGMALALVPGLPTITLDPQLALVLFLPPLLQASAYRTDWPAFRSNLRPILLLALGAVLFTAAAVRCLSKKLSGAASGRVSDFAVVRVALGVEADVANRRPVADLA